MKHAFHRFIFQDFMGMTSIPQALPFCAPCIKRLISSIVIVVFSSCFSSYNGSIIRSSKEDLCDKSWLWKFSLNSAVLLSMLLILWKSVFHLFSTESSSVKISSFVLYILPWDFCVLFGVLAFWFCPRNHYDSM